MQTEPIRSSGAAQPGYVPAVTAHNTGTRKNKKRVLRKGMSGASDEARHNEASVRVDLDPDNGRAFDESTPDRGYDRGCDNSDEDSPATARDDRHIHGLERSASYIASFIAAVQAFTEAYNALSDAFYRAQAEQTPVADENRQYGKYVMPDPYLPTMEALRAAVYQPVLTERPITENTAGYTAVNPTGQPTTQPAGQPTRRVSLYEIGVAHSPNSRRAGRLTVNNEKLVAALKNRENDVQILFAGSAENLPLRLRTLLRPFLTAPEAAAQSTSANQRDLHVYSADVRDLHVYSADVRDLHVYSADVRDLHVYSADLLVCCEAFLAACDRLYNFFISTE